MEQSFAHIFLSPSRGSQLSTRIGSDSASVEGSTRNWADLAGLTARVKFFRGFLDGEERQKRLLDRY